MNRDEGSYQLSHTYDRFLGSTLTYRAKNRKMKTYIEVDRGRNVKSKELFGCFNEIFISTVFTLLHKSSIKSRKHTATLSASLPVLLNLAVHVLSTATPLTCSIDFKIANVTFDALFFSTGLPTFILACLSFHSFPQTLQH